MRYIIGVDMLTVRHIGSRRNMPKIQFPFEAIREYLEDDNGQVIETYATAVRYPTKDVSDEEALRNYRNYETFAYALEDQGVSVIESPAKPAGEEVKHSDDQRLMITLALSCMRIRPDFMVLVATDGDFAPLVWGLRHEGIRTKLITDPAWAAGELKRACYSTWDIWDTMEVANRRREKTRR